MKPSSWKLYCIIDKEVLKGRSSEKVARDLFKSGVNVVQLRYKNLPSYKLVRIAKGVQRLAKKYGKTLLINDRIDVAAACGAGGVHLGRGDFNPRVTRLLLGPKSIIGKTLHKEEEAAKVKREKIDYVSAGPIFSTPLKKNLGRRGIGFIKKVKKRVSVPVFAIGGIDKENAKYVFQGNADGICVTRAIFDARKILHDLNRTS